MINKIQYFDFEPKVIDKSFWGVKTYESQPVVMERVNEWVRRNYNHEIINVETIVLHKSSTGDKNINASRLNMHSGIVHLIQLIRVWYK
jgi:hypothetical protein